MDSDMRKNETISSMVNEAASSNGYALKKNNGVSQTYLNETTGDKVEILSSEFLNQKTAALSIQKFFKYDVNSMNLDID